MRNNLKPFTIISHLKRLVAYVTLIGRRGSDKITGFTWHHHQDMGRMQLIPQSVHDVTGHVGGMKMWTFESK